MSTFTCSNFLPRKQLSMYGGGRYLLTVHGPYLELYDMNHFFSDEFNAREYEPIRTRVFKKNEVNCYAIFGEKIDAKEGSNLGGHVLAFCSDYNRSKNKLTISASLIHSDLLLEGGYADTSSHKLFTGFSSAWMMAPIPGKNEILLLTSTVITHFRYSFEADSQVVYDQVANFNIQDLLPPSFTNRFVHPCTIDASSEYSALISVDDAIILLKRVGNQWMCRVKKDSDDTSKMMMIHGLDIAVIAGKYETEFISTSSRQSGVSRDQLRLLHRGRDNSHAKALTYFKRDGMIYVCVLSNRNLELWRMKNNTFVHERNFVHSSVNLEKRFPDGEKDVILSSWRTQPAIHRKGNRTLAPDIIIDDPIYAIVVKRAMGNSVSEHLIIAFESGTLKVINMDDIIKNPICSIISLGTAKLRVESFYPCWEYPLNSTSPITRLTGLSNGVPIIIKLEKNSWSVAEIVKQSTAVYSFVRSKVSSLGQTVTVFFNSNDICFCLFNKEIRWRVDRLSCKIRECFISETYIFIHTARKMLIVDVCGLMNEETDPFVNTSIDLDALVTDEQDKVRIVSMFVLSQSDRSTQKSAFIYFKDGILISVELALSPLSREIPLQDLHDRILPEFVSTLKVTNTKPITEVINIPEGIFELTDDAFLNYKCGEKTIWSNNLKEYLPESAKIKGLITIEGNYANDQMTFVLATSDDYIYLKDVASMDDLGTEPIPSRQFGDNFVFGHFDGPKEHGRCILYSTSTRKFGDVPELIRVEMRVHHARHRETLIPSGSLFQPDTVVRLVSHMDSLANPIVSAVSTYGMTIELQELSGKGKMKFKNEIEMRTANKLPIFIASFDTYYVHSSNTMFIAAGSITGEIVMLTWDTNSNKLNSEVTCLPIDTAIREVFFFGREHATNPPSLFVYRVDSAIKVIQHDHEANYQSKNNVIHQFPLTTDGGKRKSTDNDRELVVCNGDDSDVHDIWIVDNSEAILHSGRKLVFGLKKLKFSFSSWEGRVESLFMLSTRESGDNRPDITEMYADFVFVVKGKGRIGILATVQRFGELPREILFTELCSISKSLSIAIHVELVDWNVRGSDDIDANIRLFIAKEKLILISIVKLSIESGCLNVVEIEKLGKIPMTVLDPSYLVVSRSGGNTHRKRPMYGIVSGYDGTKIVRICESKLKRRLTKNELMEESSVEKENL